MKGTTKLNTLTNIVYILTDVLETNLMDMEAAYRREGYGLRHDVKRQYNAAIHAIRRLKADINKCSAGEQESFGNDADMVNALLLTLLDRVGDDDMLAFKFFNYLKAFPRSWGWTCRWTGHSPTCSRKEASMNELLKGAAIDIDQNPKGTHEKMARQREKEKRGRFVRVPVTKTTYVFVRNGENEQERINAYLERINNRPKMWN